MTKPEATTPSHDDASQRYHNGDYLAHNQDWHAEDSPWKAEQIDQLIQRNELSFSQLCEVGCGAGEILVELSKKPGYQDVSFTGYEISSNAYEICHPKSGPNLSFHLADLLELDEVYDVALCIDVFEHVENYMGFLRALRSRADYKIFHIPLDLSVSALLRESLIRGRAEVGHLHYFTPKTALATLSDCGYEIIDTMFTPAFASRSATGIKSRALKVPRHLLYSLSPQLTSTLIGGCSLLVLAR